MIFGQERSVLSTSNMWIYRKTEMMQEAMGMAQGKAVLRGACWVWYHPRQIVSGLVRENVSKRSSHLCLALWRRAETLPPVIAPGAGCAVKAQFWASVVTSPRVCTFPAVGTGIFAACGFWEWLWVVMSGKYSRRARRCLCGKKISLLELT